MYVSIVNINVNDINVIKNRIALWTSTKLKN